MITSEKMISSKECGGGELTTLSDLPPKLVCNPVVGFEVTSSFRDPQKSNKNYVKLIFGHGISISGPWNKYSEAIN